MKVSIGPLFLLFCLFLTLKLCKVIAWSWLWVFSPLWIPVAIGGIVMGVALLLVMFFGKD